MLTLEDWKRMSTISRILSLLTAGSMMVSGALNTAAPQNDVDGPLFLVNRHEIRTQCLILKPEAPKSK